MKIEQIKKKKINKDSKNMKVLLINDEFFILQMLAQILKKANV
jgi:hypothetical protein